MRARPLERLPLCPGPEGRTEHQRHWDKYKHVENVFEEVTRLRQEVPRFSAQAAQVEAERPGTIAVEYLLRTSQLPGVEWRRGQALCADALFVLGRMQAHKGRVELRTEVSRAREDPRA